MKLFGKTTITTLAAVATTATMGLACPMVAGQQVSQSIFADSSVVDNQIYLTNYKASYNYNEITSFEHDGDYYEGYLLPQVDGYNASAIEITAKNAAGKKVEVLDETIGSPKKYYVVTNKAGKYYVTYKCGINSRTIVIEVKADNYAFSFDTNTDRLLPSVAVKGDEFKLPVAHVMHNAGMDDEAEDVVATNAVDLKMMFNKTTDVTSQIEADTITGSDYDFYKFTFANAGTYDLTYSTIVGGKSLSKTYTISVLEESASDIQLAYSSFDANLNTFALEVGKCADLPKPTVKNVKNNDAIVDAVYTTVTVEDLTAHTTRVVTDFKYTPMSAGSYKFTYKSVDAYGNSTETVFQRDGIKLSANSIDFVVSGKYEIIPATATQQEKVRFGDEIQTYDTHGDNAVDLDDIRVVDYGIATVAYLNTEYKESAEGETKEGALVYLPAMYAVGGWGDYSNLKITRTVVLSSTNTQVVETSKYKYDASAGIWAQGDDSYKSNEDAMYMFTKAGEYTVRYAVSYVDDEGNTIANTTKTLKSYTITVKDGTPTDTLAITRPSMETAIIKADKASVTFDAPIVTDKDAEGNAVDTNMLVVVEYTYADDAGNPIDNNWKQAKKNANGSYTFELDAADTNYASAENIIVRYGAIADSNTDGAIYYLAKNSTDEEVTVALDNGDLPAGYTYLLSVVQLVDYSSDTHASTLDADSPVAYSASDKQFTLPAVKITRTTDDTTQNSAICYVSYAETDTGVFKEVDSFALTISTTSNPNEDAIVSTTYNPSKQGFYRFTYVVTDQNYNVSAMTLSSYADFMTGYSVSIAAIPSQEYGDSINLTKYITVTKNGAVIDFADADIMMIAGDVVVDQAYLDALDNNKLLVQTSGAYQEKNGGVKGEIICLNGSVSIQVWAKDSTGVCDLTNNASGIITFESADTIKPTFKVEGASDGAEYLAQYDFPEGASSVTIEVPWFDADSIIDAGTQNVDDFYFKIEVFKPNNTSTAFKTFTVDNLNEIDGLKFVADTEGKYTVKYSLVDAFGNASDEQTYLIAVGDVTPPQIKIEESLINAPTAINGTFSLDLDQVKIDGSTIAESGAYTYSDLVFTITKNGTKLTEDDYTINTVSSTSHVLSFTADVAGTYVISFDITDKAGNKATTVSKSYTIKSNAPNHGSSTTAWGTALIVVALVVLALVLFFFIKPSKSKTSQLKTTKKKDDEKKSDTE